MCNQPNPEWGVGAADSGSAFHNLYLGTMTWLDYDNDGDLDLLLAGNASGTDVLSISLRTPDPGNLAGPPGEGPGPTTSPRPALWAGDPGPASLAQPISRWVQ